MKKLFVALAVAVVAMTAGSAVQAQTTDKNDAKKELRKAKANAKKDVKELKATAKKEGKVLKSEVKKDAKKVQNKAREIKNDACKVGKCGKNTCQSRCKDCQGKNVKCSTKNAPCKAKAQQKDDCQHHQNCTKNNCTKK